MNFLCLILLHPVPIDPQSTILYVYTHQTLAMAPAMSFPVREDFNFTVAVSVINTINSSEYIEFNIPGVTADGVSLFTNTDFETLGLDGPVLPAGCKLAMVTFNEAPDDIDVPENSDEFTVFFLLDSNHRPVYDDAHGMIYVITSDSQDPFEIEHMFGYAAVYLDFIFENNL